MRTVVKSMLSTRKKSLCLKRTTKAKTSGPKSVCAFAKADLGLHLSLTNSLGTTECIYEKKRADQTVRIDRLSWSYRRSIYM